MSQGPTQHRLYFHNRTRYLEDTHWWEPQALEWGNPAGIGWVPFLLLSRHYQRIGVGNAVFGTSWILIKFNTVAQQHSCLHRAQLLMLVLLMQPYCRAVTFGPPTERGGSRDAALKPTAKPLCCCTTKLSSSLHALRSLTHAGQPGELP